MPALLDIRGLFPRDVVCAVRRIGSRTPPLHPREQAAVARAVPRRQREFAAGRACARAVLKKLGVANPVLAKKTDGSPAWPHGIVGSIAHSTTWCAAAAAPAHALCGIGLDIETIARVHCSIARKIMTEPELRMLAGADPQKAQTLLCLVFSAKESVYKCLYPVWGIRLGFHDAVIMPHPAHCRFDVRLTTSKLPVRKPLVGSYLICGGTIVTGISVPPEEKPSLRPRLFSVDT